MSTPNPTFEHDRPAPPGARERLVWLGLAIAAPPLAWNLQLLLLSAFSNYACYPGMGPLAAPAPGMEWVAILKWGVDIGALAIAAVSGVVSLYYLRLARAITRRDRSPAALWHYDSLCFMAFGGLLSSGGFFAAVVFEAIASIMVHSCAI